MAKPNPLSSSLGPEMGLPRLSYLKSLEWSYLLIGCDSKFDECHFWQACIAQLSSGKMQIISC